MLDININVILKYVAIKKIDINECNLKCGSFLIILWWCPSDPNSCEVQSSMCCISPRVITCWHALYMYMLSGKASINPV